MQLLKDILSIEEKQKDKVLLLLDGYDEVAHLNMSNRNDFKDIMDEVSEHKNVIMSSRPNALVDGMSSQFERKVENTGWDTEGIEKYINKNFEDDKDKKFGVQLKSFLAVNSQIKEICEIPINTALICLVWNDKDTREKLQKDNNEDFNISQLYQEVVKVMPSLATRAYKELVELLKSSNDDVKSAAASSLTEVVKAMPAGEVFKELVELIKVLTMMSSLQQLVAYLK